MLAGIALYLQILSVLMCSPGFLSKWICTTMLLLRTHNAEENNQLHFTEGLAWYYDTCYGARKFPLISQYTSYVVNLYVSRRALVILANSLDNTA